MARGPGHRPLTVLRWILLGLLLISGATVLRLYLARDSEPAPPRTVADDPASPVDSSELVLAAEGFEYEVIEEGVTLFFIRAERMASDRRERFVLEGVELRMEAESGDLYTVASERAVYDLESKDATLEGTVVMTGPDGMELRGAAFDLRRGGRILESTAAPVSYRLPGAHTGTASGVRINLHLNNLVLRGGVAIDSPPGTEPPMRLTAARMLYRQQEGLLRTEGDVVLTRGGDRLSCRRLSVNFEKGDGGPGEVRFIQGRWQVAGRLALDGDRALDFVAGVMGVALDSTGDRVESVTLEGGRGPAVMRLDDGAGIVQTLVSQSILVAFSDGAPSGLETFVPAVLEEGLALPGSPPLKRLCGDAMTARIGPDGALTQLVVDGAVDYHEATLAAGGDRLAGDPRERMRLTGAPARLLSEDDDVEAPEIVYSRGEGSLVATGGVRAIGLDRSGVELATGDERAPVMVTADEATWRDEPPEIAFLGEVRAWQGESFLLADRLRVLENGERLAGDGGVKTVWRPPPGSDERRAPIEVNADEFVYLSQERWLGYSGAVRAHEAGRTLRCEELELQLDAERRIETLDCRGDAVVEDPVNGRTVRGSEALYTPADGLVLISGAPVVLEQRDGTEMEGRRLRYDLDTGQVTLLSEPRTSPPEAEDAADPAAG